MCAGIGAPGTLQEIFRGYVGDYSAPERFPADETVKVGQPLPPIRAYQPVSQQQPHQFNTYSSGRRRTIPL